MFDGEIVKKKISLLKKFWTCKNFQSKTEPKTKLDLENLHQIFFFCKKP